MPTKNAWDKIAAVLTLLVLTACQARVAPTAVVQPTATVVALTPTPPKPAPEAEGSITVGDTPTNQYRLDMSCRGQGSPTIVLDSGVRGEAQSWVLVELGLAASARVCAYQRTGTVGQPLTLVEMTNDLHAVLAATGIQGPYVLVGQSFAGMRVRMFAQQYPSEVVGMVLVDADHEDAGLGDAAVLPPASPDDSQTLREIRQELANPGSQQDPTVNYPESYAQMRSKVGNLGGRPLIVLTAGLSDFPPDFEPEIAELLAQSWLSIQTRQAELSSNSIHTVVADSGHNIHVEKPQVVIEAIQHVLAAAQTGSPLAAATATPPQS